MEYGRRVCFYQFILNLGRSFRTIPAYPDIRFTFVYNAGMKTLGVKCFPVKPFPVHVLFAKIKAETAEGASLYAIPAGYTFIPFHMDFPVIPVKGNNF